MSKNVRNQKGRKRKNSTLPKNGRHEKYNIDDEIVIGLNIQQANKPINKKIKGRPLGVRRNIQKK